MAENVKDNAATEATQLDAQKINSIVEDALSTKLKYIRALVIAFTSGFLLLVGAGIIGGKDLIRMIHNQAFPPQLPDHVAVAYESSLKLAAADARRQSQSISFWSTEAQEVDLFVRVDQVERSAGAEERKILISLNGQPITDGPTPVSEIEAAFRSVTSYLREEFDFSKIPEVHTIVFSLDDAQLPTDPKAEILVSALVLVKGAEK